MDKLSVTLIAAAAGPAFGPTIVTLFGVQIPVLSLALSTVGLLTARAVAPKSVRKLTTRQEVALTILLFIVLFMFVTGEVMGDPMGGGMAAAWGIGLGFSGLMVVEFFGEWVQKSLRKVFSVLGIEEKPGPDDPPSGPEA